MRLTYLGARGMAAMLACTLGLLTTPGPARALTLNEALRLTLAGHPQVQQKRHLAEAAEQDLKGAQWQRYPSLTVEANSRLGTTAENRDATSPGGTVVRVDQPLWSAGRITADIDAAERRVEVARLAVRETETDLLARTVAAYCEVWRWRERLVTARENATEHERLYQMIRRRADQEVSAEIDAALAQARWQQAQTEVLSFQASLSVASSALQQLTGSAAASLVQDEPLPLPDSTPLTAPASALLPDALAQSATLQRLTQEAELARQEASSKAAAVYPTLSARYEHVNSQGPVKPYDQAALVFTYQPGAGLSSINTAESARRRVLASQDNLQTGQRELTNQLQAQVAEAQSLASQKGGTLAYAKAMADVMASYLRQYTVGRKSWLEVLNAQRDVASSRYSASDLMASLTAARLKLDTLTGQLRRETLNEAP
jgi:adhesin transport system outer membrane protein